uniref:Uncharacterized protein n=1 Tax=Ditylenchus dipsaci TaxID=166011 RepID=A0A915EF17_9BILA
MASIFSSKGSREVDLSVFYTVPTHWIPVLNPIITIIVVKPYRRTFARRKETNSIPIFHPPINNANRMISIS